VESPLFLKPCIAAVPGCDAWFKNICGPRGPHQAWYWLEGVEKPSPAMTGVAQELLPVTGYARVAPPPSAVKDFAFGFGFDFSG
jgi:hypothetical protein